MTANDTLNESRGGSDESCCSAESADILEACIASAMPSKAKVGFFCPFGEYPRANFLACFQLSLSTTNKKRLTLKLISKVLTFRPRV